jgi:hypothetical protein
MDLGFLQVNNKFIAWSKKISDTISSGVVIGKEFESTIGRLNYLALVVPFVNHFLSRLRELLQKAKKSPPQRARIPPQCIDNNMYGMVRTIYGRYTSFLPPEV